MVAGMPARIIYPVFLSGYPCRYRCVYCNAAGASGCFSPPDWTTLALNIRTFLAQNKHRAVDIAIYGNDPGSLQVKVWRDTIDRLHSLANTHPDAGLRVSMRPDTAIGFGSFRQAGIRTVEIGAPSMENTILKNIARKHLAEDVAAAVERLRMEPVEIGIQTMIGLPGGSESEAIRSARRICALNPDFVRIHPTLVLKNTPLETMFHSGEFHPLSLEDAVVMAAQVVKIYRAAGIAIARCGFHLPDEIRDDVLVAGPFHPAFGSMVNAEIRYREMRESLIRSPNDTTMEVPEKELPDYIGYRRRNLQRLRREFGEEIRIAIKKPPG